mmetsp:Transcript_35643/g.57656  ORF Transcript_35643/g.57656 Transcript_35643/m.57656 type:complete len:231 (+) Transcript_35643:670-1362(+)
MLTLTAPTPLSLNWPPSAWYSLARRIWNRVSSPSSPVAVGASAMTGGFATVKSWTTSSSGLAVSSCSPPPPPPLPPAPPPSSSSAFPVLAEGMILIPNRRPAEPSSVEGGGGANVKLKVGGLEKEKAAAGAGAAAAAVEEGAEVGLAKEKEKDPGAGGVKLMGKDVAEGGLLSEGEEEEGEEIDGAASVLTSLDEEDAAASVVDVVVAVVVESEVEVVGCFSGVDAFSAG